MCVRGVVIQVIVGSLLGYMALSDAICTCRCLVIINKTVANVHCCSHHSTCVYHKHLTGIYTLQIAPILLLKLKIDPHDFVLYQGPLISGRYKLPCSSTEDIGTVIQIIYKAPVFAAKFSENRSA